MGDIHLNERGEIIRPDPHDALLVGVRMLADEACAIEIHRKHGVHYRLSLTGVARLTMTDFWEGNVICRITVEDVANRTAGELVEALRLEGCDLAKEPVQSIVDRMDLRGYKVLRLDSSYGCRLVAVCRSVESGDMPRVVSKTEFAARLAGESFLLKVSVEVGMRACGAAAQFAATTTSLVGERPRKRLLRPLTSKIVGGVSASA